MDDTEKWLPLGRLILWLIAGPVCIAVFFGAFALKGMAPSVFRCSKCSHQFTRKAWRGWPRRCSSCGARDWNEP